METIGRGVEKMLIFILIIIIMVILLLCVKYTRYYDSITFHFDLGYCAGTFVAVQFFSGRALSRAVDRTIWHIVFGPLFAVPSPDFFSSRFEDAVPFGGITVDLSTDYGQYPHLLHWTTQIAKNMPSNYQNPLSPIQLNSPPLPPIHLAIPHIHPTPKQKLA